MALKASGIAVTFTVTTYTIDNTEIITQVTTNRIVSCHSHDVEVFPCLTIGNSLKIGTQVSTILEMNVDGNAFNVSGFLPTDYPVKDINFMIGQMILKHH